MNLTANDISTLRGRRWTTDFNEDSVMDLFEEFVPSQAIMYSAKFSLSWFVQQIFVNQKGKPLTLLPFQMVMLDMLWHKKFPMILASRGAGKTFMLALYALLRCILVPGTKVIIAGSGFRQSKLVFKYIEQLYNASPLIKEALAQFGGPKFGSDAATLQVGLSSIMAIPIGDGEKIRGLRATVLIVDEFASISEEIFDIVLKPFTAVHLDPAESANTVAFIKRLKKLGAAPNVVDAIENTQGFGNQTVISGTPGMRTNHFYKRWSVYKMFIESKGDPKQIKRILEQRALETTGRADSVDQKDVREMSRTWDQYAIYQLPYDAIPEGFLDNDTIRSDRANFPKYRFDMEYRAMFPDDSDGFIKRSWIDRATPQGPDRIPVVPELYGNARCTYVLGLDPARWNDNFGAVVLKLTARGRELVYCDAWDRTEYNKSADKIREICKRFPISYIAMDAGGGGWAVQEWLCKKQDHVKESELLWPLPDQLENKADLGAPGQNIIDMVNFTGNWITESAHGLEASIQQSNLMFPIAADLVDTYDQYMQHFDRRDVTDVEKELLQQDLWGLDEWEAEKLSSGKNKVSQRMGLMQHVHEVINETCSIVRTVSAGGQEKFELPKLTDQPNGLDMRRRDRWSALMLANYAAKVYLGSGHAPEQNAPGMRRTTGGYTRRGPQRRGNSAWYNPNG